MIARGLARATLGAVFLYFGAGELIQPGPWIGYMPPFFPPHVALWLVLVHGFVLFVVGGALIVGTGLRYAFPLAFLLMASIAADLLLTSGASAIWIRDLGLTALTVSVWAGGEGLSLDALGRSGTAMPAATQTPFRPMPVPVRGRPSTDARRGGTVGPTGG